MNVYTAVVSPGRGRACNSVCKCSIYIGVGRHFEVGVLNRPVRACAKKGAGREEPNGTGYICARKKQALR